MEDDRNMEQAARGDREAFGLLVRRHQGFLLRFASRMTGSAEDAEDIVQEAFLRLWRARERYCPKAPLRAYLLQVTRNLCLDTLKHRKRWGSLEENEQIADCRSGPGERADAGAMREALGRALDELPYVQREVFVLSVYEELSYPEIAALLGCPVGTVASRKSAAVQKLREKLTEWEK